MSFFSHPSVFTKSENCPSEVPPTAGRRGTLSPEPISSATFHEAILDSVSSVRDSLPEQQRVHFETLRQEIIDFAASHNIPKEALTKPDALRKAAEKLSILELTQLANLLERFEYLLKNREPKKEEIDPAEALEYAEEHYYLSEQYDSQVELLEQVGILKEGAILGIDGYTYPIPTLEQIATRLFERREELYTKHDQGFTKLLLVPFGMSLDALQETLKRFLLSYKQSHLTFNLDTDKPLWIGEDYQGADTGDSPNLVYYPQFFIEEGHGGKTKREILEGQETPGQARGDKGRQSDNGWKGWTIHLLQPSNPDTQDTETPKGIAPIPRKGKGIPHPSRRDGRDRPPLEAGQSPNEYLSILQKAKEDEDSPYHHESGLTPEDWIIAFMIHLQETGKPLDDAYNPTNTESYGYFTGAFLPSSILVPGACWSYGKGHVILDWSGSGVWSLVDGVRSSVMV